jgi:hypothetical protein
VSDVEVYDPKFDDFHGEPMVTWREKSGAAPRVMLNLLEQYRRWKNDHKGPRYDLPAAFWQTNGPAIVRALGYCGAKALVFDWVTDRKVCYRWFAKKPGTTGADWYHVCSVSAEGGTLGADSRVNVELPNGESIHGSVMNLQLRAWVKPEPKVEEG